MRWVSGSKRRRLSTVSPKNSRRTGSSPSEGKTSRMPPRRATCPGAVTGSSRDVAAFLEGLEQDLGRHLVARREAHHARLEQVRGEARPEEAAGEATRASERRLAGGEERRGPAGGGVDVAGQPAEGRGPGGRKREHGPVEPGLGGERAQVLGGLVDVALAGHHDEDRGLGEEERAGARGPGR